MKNVLTTILFTSIGVVTFGIYTPIITGYAMSENRMLSATPQQESISGRELPAATLGDVNPTSGSVDEALNGVKAGLPEESTLGSAVKDKYEIGADGLPSYTGPIDQNPSTNQRSVKEAIASGVDYLWNTDFNGVEGLSGQQKQTLTDVQNRVNSSFDNQDDFTRFKWGQAFVESGQGEGFNLANGAGGGPDSASGLYQMVPSQMNDPGDGTSNGFNFTQEDVFDPTKALVASEVRTQWFAEQPFSQDDPYGFYHGVGNVYPDTAKAYGEKMQENGDWDWTPGMGVNGDESTRMWSLDPRALQ